MNKNITINKLEATLNYIKDSETLLNGEYFKVHSDYIYALEEEINKIDNSTILIKIGDAEEVRETIERLQNIIKEAKEYIKKHSSYPKIDVFGIPKFLIFNGDIEELLEILDKENI